MNYKNDISVTCEAQTSGQKESTGIQVSAKPKSSAASFNKKEQ
jgi:hypothetical protein